MSTSPTSWCRVAAQEPLGGLCFPIYGTTSLVKKLDGECGAKPIGVLDLKYRFFGCLVDPSQPPPPPAGLGAQKCEGQSMAWSAGRSIIRLLPRFDFGLDV